MKTYLQMDGDKLVEYVEKREHDALMLVAHDLLTERDEARGQLDRICKEGFGNDDTIGLEPADDYVLRQVAKMRAAYSRRCDWNQDSEWNWDTSCKQYMYFEYAPPAEQGYKFCHHCGATIHFIKYIEEEQP